ncbi:MAG: fold metallo-hydrolase [Nocardioides sp.]|uniref:MBL fold metallo-hydrolase n=1 Tax=Nocardioides sp. TaxID=35761 RepID=UPI002632B4E6|nr:MBL fold metallo-hydrolase [Nocardioides sp.]MCW2835442.1 fold metallo-hydrolase [Nocardioides sp.]
MPHPLSEPTIIVTRRSADVRIHTFVASFLDNNIANATHIIEGPTKLVLVDAQFLAPYARRFREYADGLGKPIDRLYLSHRHPDHWFGLATAFRDVPVFALAETVDFLREHGSDSVADHSKMGENAPPADVVVPEGIVGPGEETIDGIRYVFDVITDTEIDYHLAIKLPDLGVCVAQDLIYSGTHLYLSSDMQHWIEVLGDLLTEDHDLFLAGHGLPADKNEVARNIEYLAAAAAAVADGMTGADFKNFMLARYPERRCPGIFDIYLPRLFGGAASY